MLDIQASCSQTEVQSFAEEVVGNFRREILDNGEHDGYKLVGEEGRPVVVGSVNPAVEEIVVSVGKSLGFEEPLLGCLLVKNGSSFGVKRIPSNVETSLFSLFDPIGPFCALNAMCGPVPTILALANVKLAVKTQRHYRMTNVRSSSIHNNGVKSIETHDREEIS